MVDKDEFLVQLQDDMSAVARNQSEGEDFYHFFFNENIPQYTYSAIWEDDKYRGWDYETVKNTMVGYGQSGDEQYAVVKFSKEGEDDIFVKFDAPIKSHYDVNDFENTIDYSYLVESADDVDD